MFPFIYPKGMVSIPAYKKFFTLWTYLSALIAIGMIINRCGLIKTLKKPWIMGVVTYSSLMLFITLLVQHGVHEGFQKIFITPIICIIFDYSMSKYPSKTISTFSNILIFLLFLNDTVLNPFLFTRIINSYHVMFLGHVQVASQYAILGLLMAVLSLRVNNDKKKCVILSVLSVGTLLMSDTSAGYICLIISAFAFIFQKWRLIKKIFSSHPAVYAVLTGIISIVLILSAVKWKWYRYSDLDLTYSGRVFVWQPAFDLIKEHWLIGYGAFGVLIKTFWSVWNGTNGMNYAHSEIMQNLLDGGIVLLSCFIIMMLIYLSRIGKIKDKRIRYWVIVFLCCFLFLGLFESITEYFYFYIFLSVACELYHTDLYYSIIRRVNYGY